MRRALTVLALATLVSGAAAAPALAGPTVPSVPQDCRELQALLHIENVKDCRDQ